LVLSVNWNIGYKTKQQIGGWNNEGERRPSVLSELACPVPFMSTVVKIYFKDS